MKRALVGSATAIVYLTVAVLSYRHGLAPVRPLYEGITPPPPYQWVNPPPDLKTDNHPASASKTIAFTTGKSKADSVATSDQQATIVVPPGAFERAAGATGVKVTVKPLDPATLAPAPKDETFDSNAYDFEAVYEPSGKEAVLTAQEPCPPPTSGATSTCVSIVLRFAFGANNLYQLTGGAWVKNKDAQPLSQAFQVYGDSAKLGSFVLTAPTLFNGKPRPKGGSLPWLPFTLGVAALILGTLAARVRAERSRKNKKAKGKAPRARRKPMR